MNSFIISATCPYCQKSRSPRDMRSMPGGAKICDVCRVNHDSALLALSGLKANADGTMTSSAPPPTECAECNRTPQQLRDMGLNGDKWSVILFGEAYRFFCTECADRVEMLRRELFKGTKFAQQRGL